MFWLIHASTGKFLDWDTIIRTSLTAGGCVAGGSALLLAFRRQRANELNSRLSHEHQLRLARDSQHDAAERRITELFGRAVDHLGSESAIIRLAGVYALERLV